MYGDEFGDLIAEIPDPTLLPLQIIADFLAILSDLGVWCADRAALLFMIKIDKLKTREKYERHFLLLSVLFSVMVSVHLYCTEAPYCVHLNCTEPLNCVHLYCTEAPHCVHMYCTEAPHCVHLYCIEAPHCIHLYCTGAPQCVHLYCTEPVFNLLLSGEDQEDV